MTDKSDHLIERAAALLRSATPRPPQPLDRGDAPIPGAVPQPRPAPRDDAPPRLPPGVQPILVAPARGAALGSPGFAPPGPPLRPRPGPGTGTAASELRSQAGPQLSLDVLERAGLMVARNKRTRTAEEYRIVIGRVLRALHEEPEADPHRADLAPNVVMVTSARPGEGKSFTALNLAGSIAQNAAESVLLVDVGPRTRPIAAQFGLSDAEVFMDLTADPDLKIDDLVHHTELPNLSFLPLGSRVNRRGEPPRDDSPAAVRPIAP